MDRDILKEYNVNLADIEKEVEAIMGGEDNKRRWNQHVMILSRTLR